MANQFFEYFQTTVIISLPRRSDRRRDMSRELKRLGQIIDGRVVSWFDAIAPDAVDDFPSLGAKGCFLSHLEVLRQAKRDGVSRLLILEDDAHFVRGFLSFQAGLISALQNTTWDIFYGGCDPVSTLPQAAPIASITADTSLRTSHAVAMRKDAINAVVPYLEAMLERPSGSVEGGPMHVDGAYNWFRKENPSLRTFLAVPQLITQRSSMSDINPSSRWKNVLADSVGLRRIRNLFS